VFVTSLPASKWMGLCMLPTRSLTHPSPAALSSPTLLIPASPRSLCWILKSRAAPSHFRCLILTIIAQWRKRSWRVALQFQIQSRRIQGLKMTRMCPFVFLVRSAASATRSPNLVTCAIMVHHGVQVRGFWLFLPLPALPALQSPPFMMSAQWTLSCLVHCLLNQPISRPTRLHSPTLCPLG